jgi:hypothetical protein
MKTINATRIGSGNCHAVGTATIISIGLKMAGLYINLKVLATTSLLHLGIKKTWYYEFC